jgi:predicted metal-binding membrane protein
MTVPATVGRRSFGPITVLLLCAAAVAWVGTVVWVRHRDMGAMPGTMGMNVVAFTAMWAVMMAAIMLPSVAPFVTTYSRTITQQRRVRLTALTAGYLAVWTAVGVVFYLIAAGFGRLADHAATGARVVAVASFALVGVYQLTPLKFRCLDHCRSPLGHLLHYLGFTGRWRDLRAGASHAAFCLGCCWALMVLMVAFGVMNVAAMVGLAVVIALEKVWRHGALLARIVGVGALVYAVAVLIKPGLAPGLDPHAGGM